MCCLLARTLSIDQTLWPKQGISGIYLRILRNFSCNLEDGYKAILLAHLGDTSVARVRPSREAEHRSHHSREGGIATKKGSQLFPADAVCCRARMRSRGNLSTK